MKRPMMGKMYNILPAAAIVDAAAFVFIGSDGTNGHYVDTAGFKWARFRICLGALDIAFSVKPKVSEATSIAGAGAADVAGAAMSSVSATSDNGIYIIDVPLEGRERFLQLVATGGDGSAGSYMSATVELYYPENDPITAAGYGVTEISMPT